MIISRTPHRISFFGGGTDYPSWYREHGGMVIGTAIDKYSYIIVRELPRFFEHRHRVVYSRIENINCFDEINHPAVRETLKYLNYGNGVSISHDADIPARSGMGSSSTFTVGLLAALRELMSLPTAGAHELALEAIHVEQDIIRENVGSQDQMFAAHGGFNKIIFLTDGSISVTPLALSTEALSRLCGSCLLFFTGISRFASDIAAEQIKNTVKNAGELALLTDLAHEAAGMLERADPDLDGFGRLLNETWKIKRGLSLKITNDHIDSLYDTALKNGALGGKLLGAGGGGFMLFYVPPHDQERLKKALDKFVCIPFRPDLTGAQIIFNSLTSKEIRI